MFLVILVRILGSKICVFRHISALLSNKEKHQEPENTPLNENCSTVILKKLPEKLGEPGKFLILCGFNELKCKSLANLGDIINLMPLSVWKKLGLPELISTQMTLELANRAICTPAGITRDVFVLVGKFTFPANFVIVDYESDPSFPHILGRPFLWTARALIDVHVALITFPPEYDDDLQFDIESDLKEIEYLLYHDPIKDIDSSLKDSIDRSNLADNLVDYMPEMFTEEHAFDYSSPLIFDEYDDDLFEVESDTENVYDDLFDSKGGKSKRLMLCPQPTTRTRSMRPDTSLCEVSKPGYLAAKLGCAETKVVTWDDLAFKLITLGWNVKHTKFAKSLIQG
uniref:Reverse transcriptase domain-containing protein n=1 Tax=Tanacetum cinerariifolium TaxID=118510 RepID=A0A699IM05_TANCI|nr:reverse transcriptase domain-containing protein [Tanacetum cinerariifolium]